ncbi:hypothetical protein [Paenibacillus sp. DYY-L-2]|uniref:hypothetical protein n=1 Tax=Paenibacillus sp. DYY-L-2 TaxID=3447013 RepID=UPI003F50B7BF
MAFTELSLILFIAFITLLVLTRLMGRNEISQMTFFNFVSAISIGTIGASLAIDNTLSVRNGFTALVGGSAFTIFLGFIDKNPRRHVTRSSDNQSSLLEKDKSWRMLFVKPVLI